MVTVPNVFQYEIIPTIEVLQPQQCRNIIGLGYYNFAHHYSRNLY